jgi:heme-degrading monooxygenase HmoA
MRMFIAMNRFQVAEGRGAEFESMWRERESHLDAIPGFVQFALLKGDEPGDYISHTVWQSREAFMTWAQSDAFRQAHSARPTEGLVIGHPRAAFYESVLVEGASSVARV